jgi:hypothetical protein
VETVLGQSHGFEMVDMAKHSRCGHVGHTVAVLVMVGQWALDVVAGSHTDTFVADTWLLVAKDQYACCMMRWESDGSRRNPYKAKPRATRESAGRIARNRFIRREGVKSRLNNDCGDPPQCWPTSRSRKMMSESLRTVGFEQLTSGLGRIRECSFKYPLATCYPLFVLLEASRAY